MNSKFVLICSLVFSTSLLFSQNTDLFTDTSLPGGDAALAAASDFQVGVFQMPDSTFGYDIFQNGKLLIHQPNIPAISGNQGFSREEQARAVADFVVIKIRRGEMPPQISQSELWYLMIIKAE